MFVLDLIIIYKIIGSRKFRSRYQKMLLAYKYDIFSTHNINVSNNPISINPLNLHYYILRLLTILPYFSPQNDIYSFLGNIIILSPQWDILNNNMKKHNNYMLQNSHKNIISCCVYTRLSIRIYSIQFVNITKNTNILQY